MAWFAFDIDAYDADTMHLSLAEDGAYSRLLRFYYKTRVPLPDDDRALAAIARVSIDEWEAIKKTVRAFFKPRRGKLHHKRCDRELDREDLLAKSRSERAKNAAEKRHRKSTTSVLRAKQEQAPSNTTVMLGDATRPDQTREKDTEAYASEPGGSLRPLNLKKEFWNTGKRFLEANGVPSQRTGGLLGKWRRDHGEPAVVAALARAEAECPSEIVAFIEGCLGAANGSRRLGPATGIAEGFAEAVRQSESADRGGNQPSARALLGSQRRSTA